jgi:hypothetical protein
MYINENKDFLYQWEINQKIVVENELVKEVHFSNATISNALVVEVKDGLADVPNVLLQQPFDIKAYGYCGESVRECFVINVVGRAKPSDYVYTETEILSLEAIDAKVDEVIAGMDIFNEEIDTAFKEIELRVEELEKGGGGSADLTDYVKNTDYATDTKGGVVVASGGYGINVYPSGVMYTVKASNAEIDARISPYKVIVPSNLEYAVKSVGDGYYATEAEVGKIDTALTSIIAIQNELIGGEA